MTVAFFDIKLLLSLIIFAVIIAGGWYPFKKQLTHDAHDLAIGETLATGVFLGAALLHMLPEATHLFDKMGYEYPYAFLISGAIFLFFLWFEHVGSELYEHQQRSHPVFALIALVMLSIHSVMVGAALGLSQNYSMMIMLFLAIITHKWAESFALAVQLNKSTLRMSQAVICFLIFSFMTPLGIFIGAFLGLGVKTASLLDPIMLSASAGTFLYLGTLHGLERCVLVARCCNLRDYSFVIVGFILMALVAYYV